MNYELKEVHISKEAPKKDDYVMCWDGKCAFEAIYVGKDNNEHVFHSLLHKAEKRDVKVWFKREYKSDYPLNNNNSN